MSDSTTLHASIQATKDPLTGVALGTLNLNPTLRQDAHGHWHLSLNGISPLDIHRKQLKSAILQTTPVLQSIDIRHTTKAANWVDQKTIPEVAHLVAVASGKGGVGKSTVAINLAIALSQQGASVGLMDCDFYGPSLPSLVGLHEQARASEQKQLIPHRRFGLQLMSMGFLIPQGQPLAWRGPMLHQMVQQFLFATTWGPLDYLILDLPPGTGDVQLSLTEHAPLSGAVVVTTPQEIALIDARKGYEMFRQVHVPVFGLVENMSGYVCPHCETIHPLFGQGGGAAMAKTLDLPLLTSIPLHGDIPSTMGQGEPLLFRSNSGPLAEAFHHLAEQTAAACAKQSLTPRSRKNPKAMEV
jgi:ATP-binding protein involved in chromosome partitioning